MEERKEEEASPSSVTTIAMPQAPLFPIRLRETILGLLELSGTKILADTYAIKGFFLPILLSKTDSSATHQASIALVETYYNFIMIPTLAVLFSTSIQVTPIAAQMADLTEDAQNNSKKIIADHYRNALFYSLIMAPFAMLLLYNSQAMLTSPIFNQDEVIANDAQAWLRSVSAGAPAIFVLCTSEQILLSFKQSNAIKLAPLSLMLCGLSGLALTRLTSLTLSDVLLPLFVAESYLTAILYTTYVMKHPTFESFHFFKQFFAPPENIGSKMLTMVKIGSVITTTITTEMLFSFWMARMSGTLSTEAEEAFAMTGQFSLTNLPVAIHTAVTSMIYVLNTKHNIHSIYPTAIYGITTATIASSILPLVLLAYPQLILYIFKPQDPIVQAKTKRLMYMTAASEIFNAIRFITLFQLRALDAMWEPALVNFISLAAGAMVTTVLINAFKMDVEAIGIGQLIGMGTAGSILAYHLIERLKPYKNEFEKHHSLTEPIIKPIKTTLGNFKRRFFNTQINQEDMNSQRALEMK